MIRQLVQAGMNVARLNFSHGDQAFHAENINRIRQISTELAIPVAILIDLQGPKLRVGDMGKDGIQIYSGERIILTGRPIAGYRPSEKTKLPEAPVQYASLPQEVHKNDHIFIDDGLLELIVLESNDKDILCQVVTGGLLQSNKGLNLPNASLSIPSITDKDREDLDFALSAGVDWIALSFIRSVDDVKQIKERIVELSEFGLPVPIISKIEKPEALTVIDEIIECSDGIMIARGDLGIEIAPEKVPMVQKMIIRKCNASRVPVITATQMLDSMIRNPRPTRAEASDVANAILDGTDAVMLSGETAAGLYPIESIKTMVRIAREVESQQEKQWTVPHYVQRQVSSVTDAVSHATCETANDLGASAIISATASGKTAMAVARYRPSCPIIAVTPSPMVQRRLLLVHGVFPLLGNRKSSTDEMLDGAIETAVQSGLIMRGDTVIITAGISPNMPGSTDLIKVETIPLILAKGTGITGKTVKGKVKHVTIPAQITEEDIFPDDILVVTQSHRSLIPLAKRAAGFISQEGGADCHAYTLAMELDIPALIGVDNALIVLSDAMDITMDTERGLIFPGNIRD